MKPTLYISDLDGTLLTPDIDLSDFTVETVRRLVSEGMVFSYATARSYNSAYKVTEGLGKLHLPIATYNGEAIVDSADGTVLNAVYFTEDEAAFIRGVLEQAELFPLVYSRSGDHTSGERVAYIPGLPGRGINYYLDSREGDERLFAATPENLYDGNTFYYTVIEDDRARCEAAYQTLVEDGRFNVLLQPDVYCDTYYFEVMPKEATKANAVLRLAKHLDCGKVVCFGDGANDVSMFRVADEGYAMGNASEILKAEATDVILPNSEDGVARKLLELYTNEKKT